MTEGKTHPISSAERFVSLQAELAEAKAGEAAALAKSLATVAQLSEDLRTPVMSMQAALELLLARVETEEVRAQLSGIMDNIEHIKQLTDKLFRTSMEPFGQVPVTISEMRADELLNLLMQNPGQLNINLTGEWPVCLVRVDSVRVCRVIENLLSNAVKYARGADLELSASLDETVLVVSVRDFGGGVDAEDLPLLFTRFFRGSDSVGESGTGLGLYTAKELMLDMGGDLTVEAVEPGLLFRIYFALAG